MVQVAELTIQSECCFFLSVAVVFPDVIFCRCSTFIRYGDTDSRSYVGRSLMSQFESHLTCVLERNEFNGLNCEYVKAINTDRICERSHYGRTQR